MLVGDSFSNDGIFDWAGKVDYSPEFDVDYFSESGRTLFTMANLFEDQYSENTYSGIVIAGGVNDIAGRLTLGSMQTSVATMIAQTNDEHIILLTIPPFRAIASINDQNRQDIANQFDDWIFELAANDSRISVFNIRDILDADGNEFIDPGLSFDGLHPYGCAPGAECPQQMIASRFIAQFSEAAVPVLGDFDRNLVVDGADVNDYRGTFGYSASGSFARLDLTENGTIEKADLAFLVENLVETSNGQVGTFLGDVNFDGTVDVLRDAVTLIIHLGNDVDGYYYGDIDLNGTVDVLGDVFVLISNLGKSNAP